MNNTDKATARYNTTARHTALITVASTCMMLGGMMLTNIELFMVGTLCTAGSILLIYLDNHNR